MQQAAADSSAPPRDEVQVRNATVRQSDESVLTLSTLLQALQGADVRIELKDDTSITGTLEETDGYMKCAARGARWPLQRAPRRRRPTHTTAPTRSVRTAASRCPACG